MSEEDFRGPGNDTTKLSRRFLLAASATFGVSACSRAANLIGIAPSKPLTEADIAARGHRIFITTTRRASEVEGELYSGDRGSRLGFASVDVVVPPSHQTGKVERPVRLPPDPDKHFVITNPKVYKDHADYKVAADVEFLKRPRGRRNGMLWIHGYNTTLTDAVLRLAQFVEDSGYDGVPMLYSWASKGQLTGYVYDINSALIARDRLEDAPRLLSEGEIEGLDVVAHSMGNLVAMEAIRGISNRGLFTTKGKLRNVILASPDIDVDLFQAQLRRVPPDQRRFFVLTSSDDEALSVSRFLARFPRVGQLPADVLDKLGVNVIDLSQVADDSTVHHTKFADAPEIVQLLGNRILAGDTFSEKSGLGIGDSLIIGAGGAITAIDEAR